MDKNKNMVVEIEERVRCETANINDYFELGAIYMIDGHYDKLFNLYAKLKLKPLSNIDMARAYHEEGEAFLRCGKIDEAVASFNKSLELLSSCNDSSECLLWNGLNHYNLFLLAYEHNLSKNHANDALKCFKSLIENFPPEEDDHKIYSCIADIYSKLEEYQKALASYETALKLASDDSDKLWILTGIASIHGQKKEYDQAFNYFRQALQKAEITNTPASKIHHDIGVLFYEDNHFAEARNEFQEALKNKDNDPLLKDNPIYDISIFWHLGNIAYEMWDDENILYYLTKVLEMIDNTQYYYANTHLTLGHYYAREGDYEKAREHYNQVLIAPRAADEEIEMAKDCLSKIPLHA